MFTGVSRMPKCIQISVEAGKAWAKSISFSILTIRHYLYTFTTQSPVSGLIKKHHSSHLARIQLRDMALKAQP